MTHFVTLFPAAHNVHLIKNVGQIPLYMQQCFGYESTLVCYDNDDYTYLQDEAQGLNIHFLEDTGKRFYWEKSVVRYLKTNAKQIDVLHLYHVKQATMLYGLLYKYLNPNGVLYLKSDFDYAQLDSNRQFIFSNHPLKEVVHQFMFKRFVPKIDIISTETRRAQKVIQPIFDAYNKQVLYQPIGANQKVMESYRQQLEPIRSKENIILSVGRIGTHQKNSKMLLDALAQIDLRGWKVFFIGEIEDRFKKVIDRYFEQHPNAERNIQFVGKITDRKELFSYYARAKILCMPSRRESFCTALLEGMNMGTYIIGTDGIMSIDELTAQGRLGSVVESENVEQLAAALTQAMRIDFESEQIVADIIAHSQEYNWADILRSLDAEIRKRV